MKTALILCGGGAKGAYEAGFVKACKELNLKFDIVCGTSIGSLNGCLIAQHDYDKLIDLWENLTIDQVLSGDLPQSFKIDEMLKSSNRVITFFKKYLKEKGADITPLKNLINYYYDEEKLFKSKTEFGLVTVEFPNLKPHLLTKEEMKNDVNNYLLASSSCFPAFPVCKFNNKEFIDGGYYDNLPIDMALSLKADNFIIVDLDNTCTHPFYLNKPHFTYIHPKQSLGSFLSFDRTQLDNNIRLGYLDTLKSFGKLDGYKYSFKPCNLALFEQYYFEILNLEKEMRDHFVIRKEDTINSKLLSHTTLDTLSIKQMTFISLDILLESIQADILKIYTFEEAKSLILAGYSDAFNKDYEILPKNIDAATEILKSSNEFSIISRIINQELYQKNQQLVKTALYNLFPLEVALSKLVLILKK